MNYSYENKGSVIRGLIGALLGALLGAVAWTLVGMLGYVAAVVGLLVFFLANKGYDMLGGRQGGVKIVILLVCVVLAIFVGTIGTYAWQVHEVYQEEVAALSATERMFVMSEAEFFKEVVPEIADDPEVKGGFMKDFLMGVGFAALGCFGAFSNAVKKNRRR